MYFFAILSCKIQKTVYSMPSYGVFINHTTKEFTMDGNRAFEYLKKMSYDERKAIRLLWFDDEMLESLPCADDEEYASKCKFFNGLPNEEKGELIERGLYMQNGYYTEKHDNFIEDFAERLGNAIDEKMKARDVSEG